jgi:Clp amino terminal domain, pathogenicity island component
MPSLDSEVLDMLQLAAEEAETEGRRDVDPGHILIALSQVEGEIASLFEERGAGLERIRER